MSFSDAGFRQRRSKALYPNHRLPPWFNENAPRDSLELILDASRNIRKTNSLSVSWIGIWRLWLELSKLGHPTITIAPKIEETRDICDPEGQNERSNHNQ
jgi:hypothetical protein